MIGLLLLLFLFPLGFTLYNSIHDDGQFTLKGYRALVSSTLLLRVVSTTFQISIIASLVSLLLGYPIALHLSRQSPRQRAFYLMLVLLPFWTSILVKSFAFTVILGEHGIINSALVWSFGPDATIPMLFNRVGVIVGMVNYLLPFMVFPILASLLAQNPAIAQAAEIMGAGRLRILFSVTIPLTMPGAVAGLLMTLTLSLGMYITPALLGGRRDMMIANLIDFYTRQTLDWNLASTIAVLLLALSTGLAMLLFRVRQAEGSF